MELAARSTLRGSPLRAPKELGRRQGASTRPALPQAARGFKGRIVKKSGDKTAKVEVAGIVEHPRYKKRIWRSTVLLCHDEVLSLEVT